MNRRALAVCMAPLPAATLWGWRQPVELMSWLLVGLLTVSATAGCGLWAVKCCTVPHLGPTITGDTKDTESGISGIPADIRSVESDISDTPGVQSLESEEVHTPAEILATVPGVDMAALLARIVRLEQQAAWVAGGVEDVETYANLPDPEPDVVHFLEQLDRDDHAAG